MRLIDADALIEKCGDWYVEEGAESGFIGTLENLLATQPTIQPEPQWIPCSEKLPEVKQKVLVQYADGSMATKRCNDAGHLQWFYANAVAWIPAPEPYQPQKEVTE